jgi:putative SOS response-associated peptidase YedK
MAEQIGYREIEKMCGRFFLLTDLWVITESFNVGWVACEFRQDNNISPGQHIAAVVRTADRNELVIFRWGLIPSWAKEPAIGNRMFNARGETIAEKPSFREAFKRRRCLIVANGFYEWQKAGKRKNPFHISLKSAEPFGFAGLYETWRSPDQGMVQSCTIITTEANSLLRPIHDRMPVIVPKDKEALWLDPGVTDRRELAPVLKPYPSEEMKTDEGFPIPDGSPFCMA